MEHNTNHYQRKWSESVNNTNLCLSASHSLVSWLSSSPGYHCSCRCQIGSPSFLHQTWCEVGKHCSFPLQASDISKVFLLNGLPFGWGPTGLWTSPPLAFSQNTFNYQQGNGDNLGSFSLFCSYNLGLTINFNVSPEFNSIIKIYSLGLNKVP